MDFKFWKKAEKRESDTLTTEDLDLVLQKAAGSTNVTREQAEAIPAVSASVAFITSVVAEIPVKLYKKTSSGRQEMTDDYRLKLLNDETGDLLDSMQFKKALVADYLMEGAGYCYINKRGNKIKSLHYVDKRQVSITVNYDPIFKAADIMINGKTYRDFNIMRICRKSRNGVTGKGVIEQHNLLFSAMYNAMKYEDTSMSGTKKGFLKSAARLSDEALNALKRAWKRMRNDSNDVMVLNNGIEFQDAGTTAVENQLTANKELNSADVYAVFGLNNNLFTQKTATVDSFQATVQTGIQPILEELETAFNKFLLLEVEKGHCYFKFDVDTIMRADALNRFKAYEIGLKNGWLTYDEIRAKENLPAFDIEFIKLGLDSVLFYPKDGKIYIPNTGVMADMNNPAPQHSPNQAGAVLPAKGTESPEGGEDNENRDKKQDGGTD